MTVRLITRLITRLPASWLPAAALITSCASVPAPDHPSIGPQPPEQWTAPVATGQSSSVVPQEALTDSAATPTPWWVGLGDETLSELIVEGLMQNRDLAVAAGRLEAVQAQSRIVGAARQPQVGAGGSANRARRNFIGFPIAGAPGGGVVAATTTGYNADVFVSWELDLWGRLRSGQAAALADVEAARADLAGAQLSLAAQIARLYFTVIESGHQLELARSTAASQQRSAEQIEDRYARGLRTSLDLRLARSSAASSRAMVAARETQLDGVTRQLEVLLGRYPAAALKPSQELTALTDDIPAGLPADLVARRPDLAASERRLLAARLRVTEAKRALLPRISLTASGGRSSEALGDLLDGDFSVWNLVSNVTQPLFQGGRLRAQVDLAAAGHEMALADYAATALRAFSEVETALVRAAGLADQAAATNTAAAEAQAAELVAGDRYARGLSNYIALLESQRRAFEARSQLLAVRLQQLTARIDLYLALGGDFNLASPTPSL